MELLSPYLEEIETEIAQLGFPETPENLYQPLSYFLNIGGKRIRPVLTLIGSEMFDKITPEAVSVAVGIELFHNFTLLHDDIMDNAPLRRNFQTVHEKWNTSTAILSGDVLFVKAMEKILKGQSRQLNQLFLTTAREVCEGQQMDMNFETQPKVSIDEYIEMIRLKTSVLLGCALQCGAIIGGANEEDQEKLYQLGVNIGIAFQLQDDHLDTFGLSPKVGKSIGGDILSNKKTFLYLKALELASESQKQQFGQLLSEKNPEIKIKQTVTLFNELNVQHISREKIEFYFQKGTSYLNEIQLPEERKQALKAVIDFLYHRNF